MTFLALASLGFYWDVDAHELMVDFPATMLVNLPPMLVKLPSVLVKLPSVLVNLPSMLLELPLGVFELEEP